MKKITDLLKWYMYITISILLVCLMVFVSYGVEWIPTATLWQIPLSGFVTALLTLLIVTRECKTTVGNLIKFVVHYVALCVAMAVFGPLFGWMSRSVKGVLEMALYVAVVYVLTFVVYYLIELREAKKINEKLKERYGEK